MSTIHVPSPELSEVHTEETARLHKNNRILTIIVIVLAIALIGLGIWWAIATWGDTTTDAEALVTDYLDAWAELDGDAVTSYMADGGKLVFVPGEESVYASDLADFVERFPQDAVFTPGDILVASEDYVAAVFSWDFPDDEVLLSDTTGISVFRIGNGEILFHYVLGG